MAVGTQSRSWRMRVSAASTNSSTGSSGMARRRAEALKRLALASGRKVLMWPSGWR